MGHEEWPQNRWHREKGVGAHLVQTLWGTQTTASLWSLRTYWSPCQSGTGWSIWRQTGEQVFHRMTSRSLCSNTQKDCTWPALVWCCGFLTLGYLGYENDTNVTRWNAYKWAPPPHKQPPPISVAMIVYLSSLEARLSDQVLTHGLQPWCLHGCE